MVLDQGIQVADGSTTCYSVTSVKHMVLGLQHNDL